MLILHIKIYIYEREKERDPSKVFLPSNLDGCKDFKRLSLSTSRQEEFGNMYWTLWVGWGCSLAPAQKKKKKSWIPIQVLEKVNKMIL